MQFIGNEKAREQFKNYLVHYQSTSKPVFFIVILLIFRK